MAGAKEIRTQIASIKNTQKITRAMEMVAASKMRRAKERMQSSRPYAEKISGVIAHLAHASSEYHHAYMMKGREVKRIGYIVISSDRGLCGGLNTNLFRRMTAEIKQNQDAGIGVEFCLIGKKAVAFFKRFGGKVQGQVIDLGDKPKINDLVGTVKVMLDAFERGEIDQIKVVYNKFVNTMTQETTIEQLVPIEVSEEEKEMKHHWDYIYEPDAKTVLDQLIQRFIESLVYQSVVENAACEQSARMVAMKSASDNAGDIIGELQLIYNKARQAAITQEISEIVSGAAAVS